MPILSTLKDFRIIVRFLAQLFFLCQKTTDLLHQPSFVQGLSAPGILGQGVLLSVFRGRTYCPSFRAKQLDLLEYESKAHFDIYGRWVAERRHR